MAGRERKKEAQSRAMEAAAGRAAAPLSSCGAGAGAGDSCAEATAKRIAATARNSTANILEGPEIAIEDGLKKWRARERKLYRRICDV